MLQHEYMYKEIRFELKVIAIGTKEVLCIWDNIKYSLLCKELNRQIGHNITQQGKSFPTSS